MIEKKIVNGINYHIYKTNRFKKTKVEISFRRNIEKDKLSTYAFMLGMMMEGSKKYPSRRFITIRSQELYNAGIGMGLSKKGNLYKLCFEVNFINKEYINEETYLKDALDYFYEMIYNPNFDNETLFEMNKTNLILDIESSKESQGRLTYERALKLMDKTSITTLNELGTVEDVNKVTIKDLKDAYDDLFKTSMIDVFMMGNTDLTQVELEFNKIFKLTSKEVKYTMFVDNKEKENPSIREDDSKFNQTSLALIYNTNNLTERETNIVFPIFNFILGDGGLTSKLYKYVREENSLCYFIRSNYMKYDRLLMITSGLKYEGLNKAKECINKALREMKEGKFTEDNIKEAVNNYLMSIALQKKDPYSIYFQYQAILFYGALPYEVFEKELPTVTKEEIITLANKLVFNTEYVLKEDNHE